MTTKKPEVPRDRPTSQTPYGLLYSDTDEYARYIEVLRIRDWLKAFLSDMEHLRLDAAQAVERIDAFSATLEPQHASLKTDSFDRIRASLAGNTEIYLGAQLTGLRTHTSLHWDFAVGSAAQSCERVSTGQELPYSGPFPRTADHTPAFGYHRALMAGRA